MSSPAIYQGWQSTVLFPVVVEPVAFQGMPKQLTQRRVLTFCTTVTWIMNVTTVMLDFVLWHASFASDCVHIKIIFMACRTGQFIFAGVSKQLDYQYICAQKWIAGRNTHVQSYVLPLASAKLKLPHTRLRQHSPEGTRLSSTRR